jgi:hypothetical protein
MTELSEMVNVRYMVDDVDAAVEFYTRFLDFNVLTSFAPAFADVARGNLRLLLSGPTSSAGRPSQMAPSRDPAAGTASTSSSTTSMPKWPDSATPVRGSARTSSQDPAAGRSCCWTPQATWSNSSNPPAPTRREETPRVELETTLDFRRLFASLERHPAERQELP